MRRSWTVLCGSGSSTSAEGVGPTRVGCRGVSVHQGVVVPFSRQAATGHDVGVSNDDGDFGARGPADRSGAASEGVEHLQRAAREMIAAARSFLDAAEHAVEDRRAVEELSSTVSGLVAGLGESLGRRDAPWAAAAWERGAGTATTQSDRGRDEPVVDLTGRAGEPGRADEPAASIDDTEDWARPLVDPSAPRRPSRVRRISVE